jgi:hypothetical protein
MVTKKLSALQQAELDRGYYNEYKRRIKAGEAPPFAGMMAARQQLIERNKILGI